MSTARNTPQHAARPRNVPPAPKRRALHIEVDNTPVCPAAEFAAEIEASQDPETPLYVARKEPPKLPRRLARRSAVVYQAPITALEFMRQLEQ